MCSEFYLLSNVVFICVSFRSDPMANIQNTIHFLLVYYYAPLLLKVCFLTIGILLGIIGMPLCVSVNFQTFNIKYFEESNSLAVMYRQNQIIRQATKHISPKGFPTRGI